MNDQLSKVSPVAWILENKIYNESGIPIDFRDHLFLLDIYEDQSPRLVCYKAAQIGFSTMAIIKSLWLAKMKGMDIIYTMPTANDVKDFVGGKINRIINQNPVLLSYVKDKDSVEQKQVGENIIYYRGTWTEKAAIAVSSDLNIHDEEDRSKQAVIQQYSSRLQHSRFKWEWHFSNPSVEGNGVSRYWANSDQKHWFIICNSCNTEQYLSFPESINKEKRIFQCKACYKELTREERRVGRWVRKFKDKEFSGYWISLLMAPWITANEILNYHETKSAEYFANFVLGLPYVGEGNQITPDIIYRNCSPEVNSQERIVIGCDSGLKKHYVLGNKEGIFFYGKTDTWETIENILKTNPRSIAVIDALPDLTEPRRLQETYRGRVFICYYGKDRKTQQIIRWGEGDELGVVHVDRNRGLQMVIDDFTYKRIALEGTQDDWSDYYDHWKTLFKITEVNDLGQPESKWETSTGNDHWCHACFTGDTLVTTEKGKIPIKDIKVGDYVLTRNGFEIVLFSGLIKKDTEILEVTLEDGRKIQATPEHKFWTENDEWKELQKVSMNDILVSIWNNNSTEKFINYTKENGILEISEECIGMFGNFIMEKYRKICMFIIETIIQLIMKLLTWNSSMLLSTWGIMLERRFLKPLNVKYAEMGISQKTREIIATAQLDVGLNYMGKNTIKWKGDVLSVKNDLPPIHIGGVSHVLKTVRMKELVKLKEKKDVYGLTVGDSHEYFANGILVANSLYWRVAMDRFRNDGGKLFTGENTIFPIGRDIILNERIASKLNFAEEENNDWRQTNY